MPLWEPKRRSVSQQNLTIVSFASSEMGTSGGNVNVSRQFITLRYVSWGFSLQNGGYPEKKKALFLLPNSHKVINFHILAILHIKNERCGFYYYEN
jgi:hypothetical protein